MGHIPTIVVACLASALSALYFVLPVALHFTMVVFISAAWFLVVICWLAQKSADYMHGPQGHGQEHEKKKKLASNVSHQQHTVQISPNEISQAKARLSAELDDLISSLKNKDT